jgi:hypothetical protein
MSSWVASKDPQWIMQQSPERLQTCFKNKLTSGFVHEGHRIRESAKAGSIVLQSWLAPVLSLGLGRLLVRYILRCGLGIGLVLLEHDSAGIPEPSSRSCLGFDFCFRTCVAFSSLSEGSRMNRWY